MLSLINLDLVLGYWSKGNPLYSILQFPTWSLEVRVFSLFSSLLCQDLPQQTDDKAENKTSVSSTQEPEEKSSQDQSMKIAWRYQNQPKIEVGLCF